MAKHKRLNKAPEDQVGRPEEQMTERASVMIDTSKLPIWPVLNAMNIAYSEAVVRLQNSLTLDEYMDLPNFGFRFHVSNPVTGERRLVIQRGGEAEKTASIISWSMAISILALTRPKDYVATYGESKVIGLFLSFGGDQEKKSDMDRLMLLFAERPEFEMLNLSHDLEQVTDAEKEEDQKEEAQDLQAAGKN